jgi:hypothetical protein
MSEDVEARRRGLDRRLSSTGARTQRRRADERRRGLDLRLSGTGTVHDGSADERGRGGAAAWLERGRGGAAVWFGPAVEQRWRPYERGRGGAAVWRGPAAEQHRRPYTKAACG